MEIITDPVIRSLDIPPMQCIDWVSESFSIKGQSQLPVKLSVHPSATDFINTMPCLLPPEYGVFGCKIVSRHRCNSPSVRSHITLFDSASGSLLALFEADWITAMRTGAVVALAADALLCSGASVFSFLGLGVAARAVMSCLAARFAGRQLTVRLFDYKDHASRFISEFSSLPDIKFEVCSSMRSLVAGAHLVVSCVTEADTLFVPDPSWFSPGVLLIPVHTRGFQNCDTVFDRIVADDQAHVSNFANFSRFRDFAELSDILSGSRPGRLDDSERIISYNIGIGVHDVVFAFKIYRMLCRQ